MGSKGSQQTTTTTTTPNPQALSAYNSILGQAAGVAQTPWQNYGGEFVSPVNQQQYTGIGNINQYAMAAQPSLGIAQNMAFNAAMPIGANQISQYTNPWTQNVIDATQAQFNNQNAQQLSSLRGNEISQGALGGDRNSVAAAELSNQENLAQAPVLAGLRSAGYTQGVNTALTEQQALASGAYSFGNLGVAAQNAALQGAGQQIQAGSLEQNTQQAQDTALYNQWLASRAYPFQTTQWLAGIDTGVGSQMGGTSSTQAPQPSPWSQIAGLGIGSIGLLGGTGAFGSSGWLAPAFGSMFGARGGRINSRGVAHYDDGGAVGVSPLPYTSPGHAWEPYSGGRSWVPSANITHGQGAPRPPQPPRGDSSDPMKLGEQVAGLAKYFNTGHQPSGGMPSSGVSPGWLTSGSPITTGYPSVTPPGTPPNVMPSGVAPSYSGWSGSDSPIMTGFARGGLVGYADGGAPDDWVPDTSSSFGGGLAAMPEAYGRALVPGIYDYLTAKRPPPTLPPSGYVGKVQSSDYDPYALPALREGAGIAAMAIPAGRAASLAEGVAPYIARGTQAARMATRDLMGGAAGLGASAEPAFGAEPSGDHPDLTKVFGPRPTALPEEQEAIGKLNGQISDIGDRRDRALADITAKQKAAIDRAVRRLGPGAGPQTIAAATAAASAPYEPQKEPIRKQFNDQMAPLNEQIATVNGQVTKRQEDYDRRIEDFLNSTKPFAERQAGANAALTAAPAASMASGSILGRFAGRNISPAKRAMTYGAAGLGGGLEGLIGGYYPTYADLHMPEGSAAKTQAEAREEDPRFWEHGVAPEVGMSAATAMLGAKFGMLRRAPSGVAGPDVMPVSRYPDLSDTKALRKYQGNLRQDALGRWYEPGKGMVSKDYWPPSSPTGKVMRAPEANGGLVRGYDDGGTVDTFADRWEPRSDFRPTPNVYDADPDTVSNAVYYPDTDPSRVELASANMPVPPPSGASPINWPTGPQGVAPMPQGVAPSDTGASWDAYPISMRPPTDTSRHGPLRRSDVISSIHDAWSANGMTPNGVAGVTWNVGQESSFNPTMRHPDQPHWGGEAHYAHGLYSEGGQEFLNYQKWLRGNGLDPSDQRTWTDPSLQSKFAAWNLKANYPGTWERMQNARTPQEAAAIYAREYLKPAAPYLASRLRTLGQTQGDLMPSGDATITPASYTQSGYTPVRGSGSGVAGGGDYVPLSPAPGQAQQSGMDFSANSKIWPALMAAGFGMMASRSPYPLQAVGEGALTGLGAYTKASELESARAMKQSEIDMQAQKLWQANQTEAKKLALDAAKFEWSTLQPATIQTPLGPRSVQKLPDGTYRDLQSGQIYGGGSQTANAPDQMQPTLTPVQFGDPRNKIHSVDTHPEVLDEITKTNPGTAGQGMAGKIKAISEGRESLSTVPMRDRTAVENYLHAYDPNWTQQVFAQRQRMMNDLTTNGNAGKMILAVNQLWPHLDKASKQAEALDNSDYPALNTVRNWWLTNTGDPRIQQFNSVREVAAMDAARLLRGTGAMAEKDIEFWRKNLSEAGSPRQLQNTLADLADDLMRARVGSIEQSYRTIMGKEPPDFISMDAKGALTNIVKMRELTNARDKLDRGESRESVEAGLRDEGIDPARLGGNYTQKGQKAATPQKTQPVRPASVPAGSQRSPSTGQWQGPDGTIYRPDGSVLQKAGG